MYDKNASCLLRCLQILEIITLLWKRWLQIGKMHLWVGKVFIRLVLVFSCCLVPPGCLEWIHMIHRQVKLLHQVLVVIWQSAWWRILAFNPEPLDDKGPYLPILLVVFAMKHEPGPKWFSYMAPKQFNFCFRLKSSVLNWFNFHLNHT